MGIKEIEKAIFIANKKGISSSLICYFHQSKRKNIFNLVTLVKVFSIFENLDLIEEKIGIYFLQMHIY